MSERRGTKALELWCRRVTEGYKDVRVTNMSTSWRDGLAFCAIIHNFRPDLIDFASLSKDKIYYNNELAFSIAEKHLNIPSLLDPADMVKYEVPDRFSILTYLSQYYRVFSNQEPTNTNKKATGKEPKSDDLDKIMANSNGFVGVPKREPCRKCGNPVFFAERISFEQKLYHRSCLKCARCGTQLTLGSFYETETDGEYCCETCPDEEIQLTERRRSGSPPNAANDTQANARISRSSKLLERISFFESAPLSDEEKTSNLVRRAKMSSFLKESLDKEELLYDGDNSKVPDETRPADSSDGKDLCIPEYAPTLSSVVSDSNDVCNVEHAPAPAPVQVASEPPSVPMSSDLPQVEPIDSGTITEIPSTKTEETERETLQQIESDLIVNDTSNHSDELQCSSSPATQNTDTHPNVEVNPETRELTTEIEIVQEEQIDATSKNVCEKEELIQNVKLDEAETTEHNVETQQTDRVVDNADSENVPCDENHIERKDSPVGISDEVPQIDAETNSTSLEVTDPISYGPNQSKQLEEPIPPDDQDKLSKPTEEYPSDLNPFGDESDVDRTHPTSKPVPSTRRVSTNPFGSEDEEESLHVETKPPRPPPPKIKSNVPANPFDEEEDEANESEIVPVITKPSPRKTPVPTPRKQHNHNDSISSVETSLISNQFGGSNISLASSMESGQSSMTLNRRKKSKAPDVPCNIKLSSENISSSQTITPRKKRPAPAPPPPVSSTPKQNDSKTASPIPTQRLIALDASLISNDDMIEPTSKLPANDTVVYRRTIVPLKVEDDSLTLDTTPTTTTTTSERQWEKMKDNKEAQNRNRQSQTSPISSQPDSYNSFMSNKSQQGKWKRRKGPAPALPVPLPERKMIKMLPLKEIRQEMDIIETQQQGLEKQGVILEQMIRERCEGADFELDLSGIQTNPKEVEDLIMQLFELVNEKNELFRRQAELMYLRRQHRLEQEQADLEYEIRLLMAQPERNKTDSDKEKEEALIARLVEIVQMRNEVIDCLEMDRLREAEEDMSIKQSIEERAANQQKQGKKYSDTEKSEKVNGGDSSVKLSKKEKKKLKETKKLVKSKKIDLEKSV
ncbi:MICAL-like protein 1 isoform X2 [Toxorhynchites rutilus septentrionalis]|uniref:MICAL-like protein 1 isoform X2 n=1 Tax=Toxorhynchites rutilus septentrionalis TaxID=329112 RepID=UPI002478F22D|nr:MICAL-like protein 1 isoform X2 [Toxorhynchites rutilus septentrionalis]